MTTAAGRVHRRPRGAWTIVVASLAVALCAPAASAKVNKADVGIQEQAILRRTDLPAGWRSSPDRPSTLPDDPSCAGLEQVDHALDPIATDSRDYWKTDFTRAHNSVVVLAGTRQAKRWMTPYRDPDMVTCLEALAKDMFTQPGIQGGRVYVAPMDDTPRGADDAVGFEVQITASDTSSAQTVVIIYDVRVLRVGRALTNFQFVNIASPLPEQGELVDAVIGRLQDAGI